MSYGYKSKQWTLGHFRLLKECTYDFSLFPFAQMKLLRPSRHFGSFCLTSPFFILPLSLCEEVGIISALLRKTEGMCKLFPACASFWNVHTNEGIVRWTSNILYQVSSSQVVTSQAESSQEVKVERQVPISDGQPQAPVFCSWQWSVINEYFFMLKMHNCESKPVPLNVRHRGVKHPRLSAFLGSKKTRFYMKTIWKL